MVKEHRVIFLKTNAVYKQNLNTAVIILYFLFEYKKNTVYKPWVDFLKSSLEIGWKCVEVNVMNIIIPFPKTLKLLKNGSFQQFFLQVVIQWLNF